VADNTLRTVLTLDDQYTAKLKRIGDSTSSVTKGIGKSFDGIGNNLKKFKKSLDDTAKKVGDAGKKLTLGVTTPIVGIGALALKSAMDMEQTEAKFSTVFKGMEEDAMAFIKEFQKLTPATTAQARNMASGIQDLLIPMGFAREDATKMTGEFMHVAGALQAFNSGTHDTQRVMEAMNGALTGQFESLKSLGIQLDMTTAKQKAVEMGLAATTDEVTKQDIAQVALAEIYAQSGDALSAYTEENLDAGTKLALLRSRVVDLLAELAEKFIPVIHNVIDEVEEWIGKFEELDEETQNNILKFMGLTAVLGPLLLVIAGLIKIVSVLTALFIGAATAIKFFTVTVKLATAAIKGLTVAKMLLFAKILIVVGAIMGLVWALKWLWENSDTVRVKMAQAWDTIINGARNAWNWVSSVAGSIIGAIWGIVTSIWNAGGEIFSALSSPFTRAKDFISNIFDGFNPLSAVSNTFSSLKRRMGFASGTSFFPGGMALVGETGPEMVTLPRGSKITRASETRDMMNQGSGNTYNINVTAGMGANGAEIAEMIKNVIDRDQRRTELIGA
jgi:phage-related protein